MTLPLWTHILSAAIVAAFAARAAWRIPWRVLAAHPRTLHIFCAAILILALLPMMRIGTQPGLALHLSGITAATLVMGRRLALLAGLAAHILLCAAGRNDWQALALQSLIHVLLPVSVSYGFCRLLQKILPHNPFIFTLGAGFFGGILALCAVMLAQSLAYYAGGIYTPDVLWEKYLKFLPVIIYPEGFFNGVLITAMVAFHADWISCFNRRSYFDDRRR